jgi:hypothetical protein
MNRDDLLLDLWRSTGASMISRVKTRPPRLPRSWRTCTVLKLEAKRDRRVRTAYQVAIAAEQARRLRPQVLTRACGTILDVR